MPFDWNKYKDLAEFLRKRDDEESKRSAISRLYYAVYWKARLLCEKEDPNFRVPPDNSHSTVWKKFLDKGITRKTVYINGTRLKDYRSDADYKSAISRIDDEMETAFKTAYKIINTLDSLSK